MGQTFIYRVHNKSQTIQFWILEAVLLWKTIYICWCVQRHPEDRGDFGHGSKENISECNNQLELGVYNMWCSYMALTKPHMKPGIQFIIMKIFMKIMKICPKSPRFTVLFIVISNRMISNFYKDMLAPMKIMSERERTLALKRF